ncbi:uncharacterized protein [Argopecten irradians]|uniref:uncharacterized protein n=1 Tax=Argopecten irradians TaxID=31199 RepID=UPI00371B918E
MKSKNEELQRSNKRLQKRLERMKRDMLKKNKPDESSRVESSEENDTHVVHEEEIEEPTVPDMVTPKSKTGREMRQLNLQKDTVGTPKRIRKKLKFIEKKILLANTLTTEVKEHLVKKKKKKNQMAWKGISGRYRCTTMISKALGVSRKKVRKLGEARRFKCKRKLSDSVTEFLEREDNSTTLPGKRDTKTENLEKKQKNVLSDYMKNLYGKYRFENPDKKISKSQFYALRPQHVVLANFASRKTCLCSRHQNMALKLRALIAKGVRCSKNPDECVKDKDTIIQQIRDLEVTEISYKHWKKVQEGDKFRHKEVVETKEKEEFLDQFSTQFEDFEDHVGRVQHQYQELRKLRQNLPIGEVVVWMDFAENYQCSSVEEVQSAYWNAAMVSLHTMVVYYRPDEDERGMQSYVAISDVLSHNAVSVYAVLLKLIPHIKGLVPNLSTIHYLTDSPTSQYRNKTIFRLISMHKDEFGVSARWNYLESGHGKGPCDGLGASVKRGADDFVKHGKASIQNADDFYKWAEKAMEDGSKVKYFVYDQNDYDTAQAALQSLPSVRAVTGTFRIHYVLSSRPMEIHTRETSCYCQQCIEDVTNTTCGGYAKHSLVPKERKGRTQEQQLRGSNTFQTNDTHEGAYAPHIADAHESFKYPNKPDQIWIDQSDILHILTTPPALVGSRRKVFKISEFDYDTIEEKYEMHI